ncbi:hypothetical protein U737_14885 [Methylomonas sp. LW13]|nr:hypothetical protein U737_14885 [Methylomonas sp. LW13]
MDSIKVITRGIGFRQTFFSRHSIYLSRPQTAQAQRVKIHPEKAFGELIITWNCKPDVLEAFNCRYFFNLPGQHLLVKFAQEQLVILSQTFKSLRESVYQNMLQTRFKQLLDQVTLKLDSNGIRLDFSTLEATLSQNIQTNSVEGVTDLIEFTRSTQQQFQGTDFKAWNILGDALRSQTVIPELQQVFDTFNVRVSRRLESGGQDVLPENEQAETLYGDGENANNLKDAGDYRPGIRFAAPIDNPGHPSSQVSRLKHQRALKNQANATTGV